MRHELLLLDMYFNIAFCRSSSHQSRQPLHGHTQVASTDTSAPKAPPARSKYQHQRHHNMSRAQRCLFALLALGLITNWPLTTCMQVETNNIECHRQNSISQTTDIDYNFVSPCLLCFLLLYFFMVIRVTCSACEQGGGTKFKK